MTRIGLEYLPRFAKSLEGIECLPRQEKINQLQDQARAHGDHFLNASGAERSLFTHSQEGNKGLLINVQNATERWIRISSPIDLGHITDPANTKRRLPVYARLVEQTIENRNYKCPAIPKLGNLMLSSTTRVVGGKMTIRQYQGNYRNPTHWSHGLAVSSINLPESGRYSTLEANAENNILQFMADLQTLMNLREVKST